MEQAARAAGISMPIKDEADLETGRPVTPRSPRSGHFRNTSVGDRVALPSRHNRTPSASVRSFRSRPTTPGEDSVPPVPPIEPAILENVARTGLGANGGGTTNEPAWDSLHPCWPHPNPHVPADSPLFQSTRVIRIPRDYETTGDLYPAFDVLYPEILEGCLPQDDFRNLVEGLNKRLKQAFDPYAGTRGLLDAILGAATGWLWEDLGFTAVKKGARDAEDWCVQWNESTGKPRGVTATPLRRTGYLSLDLQVPDPAAWLDQGDAAGVGDGRTEFDTFSQTGRPETGPRGYSGAASDAGDADTSAAGAGQQPPASHEPSAAAPP